MKKMISIMIMISAILLSMTVMADETDTAVRDKDCQRIHWGMAMVAQMVGNSLDQVEDAKPGLAATYLNSFSGIDYLNPEKAVIVELDKEQIAVAKEALEMTEDWYDFAPTLAKYINLQFSSEYTEAAELAQSEDVSNTIEPTSSFSLIVLPYGQDIAVMSITAYGSVNGRGAFIISTDEISTGLNEESIAPYLQQLGVEEAKVRVYEKEQLDELMAKESWYYEQTAQKLVFTVTDSEKRIEVMLPKLMTSESAYVSEEIKYHAIISLLNRMDHMDQAFLLDMVRNYLVPLGEGKEDPAYALLNLEDSASGGKIPAPEITLGDDLKEAELDPNGTYLFVLSREVPDEDPKAWYDTILESVLPLDKIPENEEDADYIIHCHTVYNEEGKGNTGITNGDAHLHYPFTYITVHDAHTGEKVRNLGWIKRELTGIIMISDGDTYWPPLRTELWEVIKQLFIE